jgi:hypothetical protein
MTNLRTTFIALGVAGVLLAGGSIVAAAASGATAGDPAPARTTQGGQMRDMHKMMMRDPQMRGLHRTMLQDREMRAMHRRMMSMDAGMGHMPMTDHR